MKVMPPPLMPIFRSETQVRLLTWLLLNPDREESLTELTARVDASWPTVQRELNRLIQAGVLRERTVGRARLISADPASPYVGPLSQLVRRAFGPAAIVAEAFDGLAGVGEVLIFGSWAARTLGEPGPPPGDIDVLVVGTPDRRELRRLNEALEHDLEMSVQVTTVSAEEWEAAETGLVQEIRERPRLVVVRAEEGRRHGRGTDDPEPTSQ